MLFFKFLVWLNIFFAVMVIFSSSVLYSILSLVFFILTSAFILLVLEVEFLSFVIMLLYIGAISVLFLFVVVMLQLNKNDSKMIKMSFLSADGILYFLFGFKLFVFILYFNMKVSNFISLFSYQTIMFNYDISYSLVSPLMIGGDSIIFLSLFTQKYFFFILIGVILLFSMVGSIILCIHQSSSK